MSFTYEQVAAVYLQHRDQLAALDEAHKQTTKPIKENMEKLVSWLQAKLLEEKLQNVKTESGTVYLKHTTDLRITDAAALTEFAQTQGFPEFFKTVVDPAAIKEYLENGASRGVPPGVEPRETITAQIRRV